MKTLKFSTPINAPKETVWNVLFTNENYPKWASVFCEGSKAKTNWKEGSEVEFTTPDHDGMFSKIVEMEPNRKMVFKHLGTIKNGKRISNEGSASDWANAKESYELVETNGTTELKVKMDATDEFQDYFKKTFPKALKRIKQFSE